MENTWDKKLPSSKLKLCKKNFNLFFETMYERQLIWKRRTIDKKERPWTNNYILHNFKFTNVYRELDYNSQWQIKNIILDKKLSLENLVWKILVFRLFNNTKTFSINKKENTFSLFKTKTTKWNNGIPDFDTYNINEFSDFIESIHKSGKNPYTSSYLMSSFKGVTRNYFYTKIILPYLHNHIFELIEVVKNAKTPDEIIRYLKEFPGVGDFTAHEFYQDFTYISKFTNKKFMKFTPNDFTNVGPGSKVGIRLIYPNLKTTSEQKQAIYWLKNAAESELKKLSIKNNEQMPFIIWDKRKEKYNITIECNISLNQIEMWLCEFQKYWKMIIEEGKQRGKYIERK